MSLWLHPGLSEAARPRVEEALRGEVPEGSVEVISRIIRRVLRTNLPDETSFYSKQNLFPFLRLRLRYLLRPSPTQKERRLLEACSHRGIHCPEPLAESTRRGLLGPRLAVLVTRALPEGRAPTPREHLRAVEELARKGLYHPDLHGDNLRILEDGQLATLDLQSCRLISGEMGANATCRMMAKAALAIWDEQGLATIEALLLSEDWIQPGPRILAEMKRLADSRLASRRRHFLRSSSRVQASRPRLGRKRLILRGRTLSEGFGESTGLEIPGLEPCDISRAEGGEWRIIRPRGLRSMWLTTLLAEQETTENAGVIAWEGPTRSTFGIPFGPEILYISGCQTESQLESLIFSLLHTQTPDSRSAEMMDLDSSVSVDRK